jgi:hypothetical protein
MTSFSIYLEDDAVRSAVAEYVRRELQAKATSGRVKVLDISFTPTDNGVSADCTVEVIEIDDSVKRCALLAEQRMEAGNVYIGEFGREIIEQAIKEALEAE